MKRIILAIGCTLLLIGCTSVAPRPKGSLLFYVKITNSAFGGPPHGDTGVFFYLEESPSTPLVVGYDMRAGQLRLFTGGDSYNSAALMRDLAQINFEPFNFDAETKISTARKLARVKASGDGDIIRVTMDGAEYEIGFNGPKGKFLLREWNPGPTIEELASESENINKLNKVINRFAEYYGRTRFGL